MRVELFRVEHKREGNKSITISETIREKKADEKEKEIWDFLLENCDDLFYYYDTGYIVGLEALLNGVKEAIEEYNDDEDMKDYVERCDKAKQQIMELLKGIEGDMKGLNLIIE